MQDSVVLTDNSTILSSFYANAQNPTYDPYATTTRGSSSATPVPSNVQTIPGVVGGGVRGGTDGTGNNGDTLNGGGNGATDPSAGNDAQSSFQQGVDANKAANSKKERAVSGSAFAVLVAVVALVMI